MGQLRIILGVISVTCVLGAWARETDPISLSARRVSRLDMADKDSGRSTELSGGRIVKGLSLFVTDGKHDGAIYVHRNRRLEPYIDFSKIPEAVAYGQRAEAASKRAWDLEGLAHCTDRLDSNISTFYTIHERMRDVLKLTYNHRSQEVLRFEVLGEGIKQAFQSPQDNEFDLTHALANVLEPEQPLERALFGKEGDAFDNAGYEGIAVNCEDGAIFLAKERGPRFILKTDPTVSKVLDAWTLAPSSYFPKVITPNPFTGQGTFEVKPDIADLYLLGDELYVLERNSAEIAVVSIDDGRLLRRYSYAPYEFLYTEQLAHGPAPFGMAESLVVFRDDEGRLRFQIGYDNGGEHTVNDKGLKKFGCETFKNPNVCLNTGDTRTLILTLIAPPKS